MKKLLCIGMLCAASNLFAQTKTSDSTLLQPVEVSAVKATEKNPFAKTNITKAEIKKLNVGQDLPFILNSTPSVVVNSDAGTGVGYTGIRIRGSDAARVNVTLNGIPYNDAESQGTFFVDLPDIASSASSIQIQRGVGTSANGAGSFGGSINIGTNEIVKQKNFELNSTVGSYGAFKNTMLFNSGIFNNHFLVDARLSNIRSEGYVDRASSRLKSFYVSGAYVNDKSSLRLNIFSGKEITYQAYYGVSEKSLDTNRTYNSAGTERIETPYENQVDNYKQTHYQLFYNRKINKYWKANAAIFLTRGLGYYEEYKLNQNLSDYKIQPYVGLNTFSDIVRRQWLNNYYYGTTFSAVYEKEKTQLIIGGGFNKYDGGHYGTVEWLKNNIAIPANLKYYNNDAFKKDFSIYTKWTQKLNKNFETFLDVQYRTVHYQIDGFKNNPTVNVFSKYNFVNPKVGVTFTKNNFKAYASFGKATKEPNRDDFEASVAQKPLPEKLNDIETGFEYKNKKMMLGTNFYLMNYKNQLVLNGKINDVGAYTRVNIDKSYRAGVEFFGNATLNKYVIIAGSLTLSSNKVKNFTDYIDNYDTGNQDATKYSKTDIAYSPTVIGNLSINIVPITNAYIGLTSKYVGKQYLDNTSSNSKQLHDFFTQDIRLGYTLKGKKIAAVDFYAQVNNIFSKLYEPNGYTFSYVSGGQKTTENYYFPMAPANFMLGVNVSLW